MKKSAHLFSCLAALALTVSVWSDVQASVLVLQPDLAAGKDTQIDNGAPDRNWGTWEHIIINWAGNSRSVGLIEFDLSPIPTGSTIHSAELSLFHKYNDSQNQQYDIFRVTSAWNESTVTFNTAPTFDPVAVSSLTIPDSNMELYRDWDVTSLVAGWVAGTYGNDGMWIEEIPVQGSAFAYFQSSDAPVSERPILTVDYTPIPEPCTLVIWSLLGALGITVGWWRRRR